MDHLGVMTLNEKLDPDFQEETVSEQKTAPVLKMITGGKDNTQDWLRALPEETIFFCRKKGEKGWDLWQYHVRMKFNRVIWLLCNFPQHKAHEDFVDSMKFSQQNELVEILEQGKEKEDDHEQRDKD